MQMTHCHCVMQPLVACEGAPTAQMHWQHEHLTCARVEFPFASLSGFGPEIFLTLTHRVRSSHILNFFREARFSRGLWELKRNTLAAARRDGVSQWNQHTRDLAELELKLWRNHWLLVVTVDYLNISEYQMLGTTPSFRWTFWNNRSWGHPRRWRCAAGFWNVRLSWEQIIGRKCGAFCMKMRKAQ